MSIDTLFREVGNARRARKPVQVKHEMSEWNFLSYCGPQPVEHPGGKFAGNLVFKYFTTRIGLRNFIY